MNEALLVLRALKEAFFYFFNLFYIFFNLFVNACKKRKILS